MAKSGQARVPTAEQQRHLFDVIQAHRHPEKNTAIMQISFKLGLRAQEIALLQIKEVARLNASGTNFNLLEVMSLPAAYTKGTDAMGRSKTHYVRRTISFTEPDRQKRSTPPQRSPIPYAKGSLLLPQYPTGTYGTDATRVGWYREG